MKTSELAGALLEYWTARAEGDQPEDLTIKRNQVFRQHHDPKRYGGFARVLDYSTNWALTGPLVEKHDISLEANAAGTGLWSCKDSEYCDDTPLIAICRAVVRAAFGDEVEDIQ